MKNLIPAGILLLSLCSCSMEHSLKRFSPRGIGSYELSGRVVTYETEIYTLKLYNKKGKIKDSVRFFFDVEADKPKRIDRNGNMRINTKKFPVRILPKYYYPKNNDI